MPTPQQINPTGGETSNSITHRYIDVLGEDGFWGFLSLKFENGKVVHIRKEESLRPNEVQAILDDECLPADSRRREYANTSK